MSTVKMKTLITGALAALVLLIPVLASAQSASARNSARIVYVGHSLINYEMPEMVKAIAESLTGPGVRPIVQVNPGAPIAAGWNNCRQREFVGQYPPLEFACDAIESGSDQGPYDTLIVTQTNNPIINSANPSDFGSTPGDFDNFLNLFLSRNSAGRAFFFAQWEALNSPWHGGQEWTTQIDREMSHFRNLANRIEQVERDAHGRTATITVIPTSLALRELMLAAERGAFPGVSGRGQIFSDDVHLTPLGNYFVACVVFASVYERSPVGATGITTTRWGDQMTNVAPDLAQRLQDLAWRVVSGYRGWGQTESPPAHASPPAPPQAPRSLAVH
jgi:hypothetical protein